MKTSDRLLLVRPVKEDFERFYEINADPETNLFNPYGAMTFERAEKAFGELLAQWEKNGFAFWSIREKENPDYCIGFGGLDYRAFGNEIKLNLGYRFDKNYWGKGYATELSLTTIDFGFNALHKKEIFAIVRPKHLVSIKVLEKCSMKLVKEINDVENEANSLIYKIEK